MPAFAARNAARTASTVGTERPPITVASAPAAATGAPASAVMVAGNSANAAAPAISAASARAAFRKSNRTNTAPPFPALALGSSHASQPILPSDRAVANAVAAVAAQSASTTAAVARRSPRVSRHTIRSGRRAKTP